MNQDPSLAESMCQIQSQPEIEGYHERGQRSYWGKTISRLRWFDTIKKLKSKLTQVISDLSTANSKEKNREDINGDRPVDMFWICRASEPSAMREHNGLRRFHIGNTMDYRGSILVDQAQTSRKLLIVRLSWVASIIPSSFFQPLSDMINSIQNFKVE